MVACSRFVDGFLLMVLWVLLMVFVGFVDAIAGFVGFACGQAIFCSSIFSLERGEM